MRDYVTCKKCGVHHSTLVRHRCFTPEGQVEKAKTEGPEDGEGGDDGDGHGKGGGGGEAEGGQPTGEQGDGDSGEGEAQGGEAEADGEAGDQGEAEGDAQGRGQGEAEGEGEGEGEQAEAEGEGTQSGEAEGEAEADGEGEGEAEDGDADGETEAPEPQPPEPDMPAVAVVCTVLKYAALTASCAKNGIITVEVAEEGLFICGHNGDATAFGEMPWSEFEKRSTLDGEFYVKERIDAVDDALALQDAEQPKRKRKAKAPKLTLPLTVGQRVMSREGSVGEVEETSEGDLERPTTVVRFDDGQRWHYEVNTGLWCGRDNEADYEGHLTADA